MFDSLYFNQPKSFVPMWFRLAASSWQKVRRGFVRELAIDLGTGRTRIFSPGDGIVLDEPSMIALHQDTDELIAVGEEARRLFGREPERIRVLQPIQSGVITNYLAARRMLDSFIRSVFTHRVKLATHLLLAAPSDLTPLEVKAFRLAATDAGATRVSFVEEAVASALGAEINEASESTSVVVDIGAGTTDIAVVNAGEMVQGRTLRLGGNDLDQAIIRYLRQVREIETGPENAERIRINLFSLETKHEMEELEIRGRSLATRLPQFCTITHTEVRDAVIPVFTNITNFIRTTLEELPLKPALDLLDTGIILSGGGALIPGLPQWLSAEMQLGVYLASQPQHTTILGLARLLGESDKVSPSQFSLRRFSLPSHPTFTAKDYPSSHP